MYCDVRNRLWSNKGSFVLIFKPELLVFLPDKQAVESIHFSNCPTLSSPRWLAWHGSTIWLIFTSVGFLYPSSLPWMGTGHCTVSDLSSGVITQLHMGNAIKACVQVSEMKWQCHTLQHISMLWLCEWCTLIKKNQKRQLLIFKPYLWDKKRGFKWSKTMVWAVAGQETMWVNTKAWTQGVVNNPSM